MKQEKNETAAQLALLYACQVALPVPSAVFLGESGSWASASSNDQQMCRRRQ